MPSYIQSHGKLSQYHLNRIEQTINKSLHQHPRTTAIRVDLHIPYNQNTDDMPDEYSFANTDASVISRFTASLKAKIAADLSMKKRNGLRIHHTTVRYIWTREYCPTTSAIHYHVVLLLNKDAYAFLGDYTATEGNLASMINSAWYSALGLSYDCPGALVYFPENPCYWLDINSANFNASYDDLVYRASYLAKESTKQHDDNQRNFGYSQR